MKRLITGVLAIVMLSCNNQQVENKNIDDRDTTKALIAENQLPFKGYETAPQVFTVSGKKSSTINGVRGTKIYVTPTDLETMSGKPISGDIKVELKELHTTEEFLRNNVATMSDGELLSSGGSYYIGMQAGGEKLRLKQGKKLHVAFPIITNRAMQLYYGQRDAIGNMNWLSTNEKLQTPRSNTINNEQDESLGVVAATYENRALDSIVSYVNGEKGMYDPNDPANKKADSLSKQFYSVIKLEKLEWINVDVPITGDVGLLTINKVQNDTTHNIILYVTDKKNNSLFQRQMVDNVDRIRMAKTDVQVIAFGYQGKTLVMSTGKYTLNRETSVKLSFKEATKEQIEALFN